MFKICFVVLVAVVASASAGLTMFDGGIESLAGMFPGPDFCRRMGINLTPQTISEIGVLFGKVKHVLDGGIIPKGIKILEKVTCSNIMPFFPEADQV